MTIGWTPMTKCGKRWRLLLTRVAQDKALPFEPLAPNATSVAAMKEARRGGLPSFKTVDALMADLNANA